MDNRFRDNYLEILKRFYLAFESIHQYIVDLKAFIQELNDGIFIQQTLESVFEDEEGKQMLVNKNKYKSKIIMHKINFLTFRQNQCICMELCCFWWIYTFLVSYGKEC